MAIEIAYLSLLKGIQPAAPEVRPRVLPGSEGGGRPMPQGNRGVR